MLALLVSACTGSDASPVRELVGVAADPIERYEFALEVMGPVTESCMHDGGFTDYQFAPAGGADFAQVDPTDDLVGFGAITMTLDGMRTALELEQLDEAARVARLRELGQVPLDSPQAEQFYKTLEDCRQQAAIVLQDHPDTPDQAVVDAFQREAQRAMDADARLIEAKSSWAPCMRDSGHSFTGVPQIQTTLFEQMNIILGRSRGPENATQTIADLKDLQQVEFEIGRASDECSLTIHELQQEIRSDVAKRMLDEQ